MTRIHQRHTRHISDLRRYWKVMTLSERFEQIIAAILGVIVAVVILLALGELLRLVIETLVLQHQNVLDHSVFQKLFGAILTLLIAMEFQHSIIKVIERREHIIQTKIVVLIGLLALARKFIILDTSSTTPMMLLALSFGVLALGAVYWLIEQRDVIRIDKEGTPPVTASTEGPHQGKTSHPRGGEEASP
ncbi:MAG: phosphate-starvation-inducible PsiE family protein [Guyparkeria sp.]|uniref:phosphate-starvation-inducible PsiE family protein n=1 Tax=Guyparkeria sp. TaxID=2035736 RepID=UPI0039791F05